jgi:hypothetical protein
MPPKGIVIRRHKLLVTMKEGSSFPAETMTLQRAFENHRPPDDRWFTDARADCLAGIGGGRFPMARQQFLDLINFMLRQASEHIREVILRIDAPPAATHEDGI